MELSAALYKLERSALPHRYHSLWRSLFEKILVGIGRWRLVFYRIRSLERFPGVGHENDSRTFESGTGAGRRTRQLGQTY